ncbi:hypothetical protein ACHWQZ_G014927 [Mnemiopsis leidyi]
MILLTLVIFTAATAEIEGDWTAVQRDVLIPLDLESSSLEIQSNTGLEIGPDKWLDVKFYTQDKYYIGGVDINFNFTLRWRIYNCNSEGVPLYKNFPVNPPTAIDKTWKITLERIGEIKVRIYCNGVEVLDVLLSETCTQADWRDYWRKDVKWIYFGWDTVSNYYRAVELPGIWTAVKPAVDLETTPLEIKTNSTLGSEDKVDVYFYTSRGDYAGRVWIYFLSNPQFGLGDCSSSLNNFPTNLPAAVDKVWRISLNRTSGIRLQIHCNEDEVLNYLLSDGTCDNSNWRDYWTRDVERIGFASDDTASDYYRLYQHHQGNWTAVKSAVDLETTPLEIKTNSTIGSEDKIDLRFYNSQGEYAGGIMITLSSPSKYYLNWCSPSQTSFLNNLPAAVDKVWRISLNKTSGIRLQIHCNKVEVLIFLLSDGTCGRKNWRDYWTRDVERIAFSSDDSASDFYRRFKPGCTGLKAEWIETITTNTKFPVDPGTVVEVTCSESRAINNGSSQLTCASGTRFTFRIEPNCTDLGIDAWGGKSVKLISQEP